MPDTRDFLQQERDAIGLASDDDAIGLALSGGGIRSATFNLGLLQGLHKLGLLPAFHYLSTVSGGGYIGGFWTMWRHHNRDSVFPQTRRGEPEPREIRHLRQFSNFLSPRLGLLSSDMGRLVVAVVTAILPALVLTMAGLVLLMLLWCAITLGLHVSIDANSSTTVRHSLIGAAGLVTFLLLAIAEHRLGAREKRLESGLYWLAALITATGGAFVLRALPLLGIPIAFELFAIALVWLVPTLAIVFLRAPASRFITTFRRSQLRGQVDRVVARLLLIAGVWVAIAALWTVVVEAIEWNRMGVASTYAVGTAGTIGLYAWLRRFVEGRLRSGAIPVTILQRVRAQLPALVAWVAVVLLAAGAAGIVVIATNARANGLFVIDRAYYGDALRLGLVSLAIVGIGLVFFDPNRIGLHSFYRGRIARAFLGANQPDTATEQLEGDDEPLAAIDVRRGGTLHLVCTTANELTPIDPLLNLHRGGRSAVLSPFGFAVDGSGRAWRGRHDSPTLGAALTASGAAFNSMMGAYTQRFGRGSCFLMAALNLRLGRWVRHPSSTRKSAKSWFLPGWLYMKEFVGASSTEKGDVHLSDGGHFENMGIYELIRRRCRYIIASDCGADPDVTFNDVANLIRRAREDFGVDIRIDVSALRPDHDGWSRQPAVAGDIEYPDGRRGILLLFKPTLTGREPPDVAQYRQANTDFPHESTLDQFYDGAQWESYRRLGEHAIETAFAFARGDARWWSANEDAITARAAVPGLFSRARFEWLPGLADAGDRLAHVANDIRALETRLADPALAPLTAEVWKEIDEVLHDGSAARTTSHARGSDGLIRTAIVETATATETGTPEQRTAAGNLSAIVEARPTTVEQQAAAVLRACRDATLFLENAWRMLELEHRHSHPDSLAIMNVAGRWAASPRFRFWWPVLRSLHAPAFVRFMQRNFRLPAADASGTVQSLKGIDVATRSRFASFCWRQARGVPADNDDFFAYVLPLPGRDGTAIAGIEAGLLRYRRVDDSIEWDVSDFFVPPGLWGTGIGTCILNCLWDAVPNDVTQLRVTLGDTMAASDESLYRDAGFTLDAPSSSGKRRLGLRRASHDSHESEMVGARTT